MKTTILSQKKIMTSALWLLVVGVLFSCAEKVSFTNSSVVPGAEGTVTIKEDKNANYLIDVAVVNLAKPDQLTPPKQTYVVWMESADGIKNLGQINTTDGLFSKTMKASLETTMPYRPNRIFITAEDQATPGYPGMQVVMETEPFQIGKRN